MTDRIHDAFDSIKADDKLKDSTKQFLQIEREKRSKKTSTVPVKKLVLAAACVFVLLVGLGGFHYVSEKPVSYISIDVNPSVELTLNCFNKVIYANAYNDDGIIVLKDVYVKGMLYTDAVDAIVNSDAMKKYLTDEAALTFTVAADSSAKEAEIKSGIDNCGGCKNHGGQSYQASSDSIDEAHENGLSFGKYSAYLILSQYDKTVTTEDCRNMTMSEIRALIRKYESGNVQSNPGGGSGNGTGGGAEQSNPSGQCEIENTDCSKDGEGNKKGNKGNKNN